MKAQQAPGGDTERLEDKKSDRDTDGDREKDTDGSVIGDRDALLESQISATYRIFSVQYKSALSFLLVVDQTDFFGRGNLRGEFQL